MEDPPTFMHIYEDIMNAWYVHVRKEWNLLCLLTGHYVTSVDNKGQIIKQVILFLLASAERHCVMNAIIFEK